MAKRRNGGVVERKDSLERREPQGQGGSRFPFCFSPHLLIFGLEGELCMICIARKVQTQMLNNTWCR